MTATFKVSLSIPGLLFGLCLLVLMCKASTSAFVEIESDFLCQISEWQTIRLKSRRNFTNSTSLNLSSLQNFSSFWKHHKEGLKKTTEEQLFLAAKYAPNCTTSCSCNGTIAAYASSNNSEIWRKPSISFPVEIPVIGARLLGVTFVDVAANDWYELQVYLRPADSTRGNASFDLNYCWLDEDGLAFDPQKICPTYTTVRMKCSARMRGVYGVANSNGFICTASVPEVHSYTTYKFKIVSSANDFTTVSQVFNIWTCQSHAFQCPIMNGERGKFQLVLISAKPSYITAKPIKFRKIAASWENNKAVEYILSYNCSNGAKGNETRTTNSMIISNDEFRPALKCLVCVRTSKVRDSTRSEPACDTTTLFIEAPSQPPTITCDADTCPSSSEGESQNVTITCEFPPRSTWNGALTRLVAKYRREGSQEYKEVSEYNQSSCRTRLPGLRTKITYFATLQACNSEGCSGISKEVKIAPSHEKMDGNSFTLWWLVAIVFVIMVAGVVIALVYYLRGRKSGRYLSSGDKQLPDIVPPNPYDSLEGSTEENCKGYDQLHPPGDDNAKSGESSDSSRNDENSNLSVE